jgi:nucleotide-binding universal stress UspA family protein
LRIILAPLFGSAADGVALSSALEVAQRFGAHATGLFVRIDPGDAIPVIGEGVSPAVVEQLTRAAEAEMDRQSGAARVTFDAACTQAGVAVRDRPDGQGAASAGWVEATGRRDQTIARRARLSDLTVMCRPGEQTPPDLDGVLEATLFGAGRPLLLIPPGGAKGVGRTVAIAWNDDTEAARALAAALPFLEAADAVHVVCAETWRTEPEIGEEVVRYLAWRRIAATLQPVRHPDEPTGAALLHAAVEAGADLLVMGGYGRSRLSELVLGGVTRHVLTHSDLPLLIAH